MIFDIQPVNEAYFGKTPGLLAIEKQLDIIRNKYMGKYEVITANTDKDVIKLNRMFEKEFGFGTFCLTICPSRIPNAYTLALTNWVDKLGAHGKDLVIKNKSGFRFNEKYNYCCMVTIFTSMIFNPLFTTPEIMAVIIHELGHNFESSISRSRCMFNNLHAVITFISLAMTSIVSAFAFTNQFWTWSVRADKYIKENLPALSWISDFISMAANLVVWGIEEIYVLIDVLTLGISSPTGALYKGLSSVARNPLGIFNYEGELTADNFATMYGYGPEMASVANKFKNLVTDYHISSMLANQIPILNTLIQFNKLPAQLILGFFDCHPYDVTRALDQVNLLEYELKKANLDPKMKKQIQQDLKQARKELDKLQDLSKGIKDPYLATKAFNRFMVQYNADFKYILSGTDRRYKEYDLAVDRAEKQ